MKKNKFRVSWTEYHSVVVEAKDRSEAHDKAINEDQPDSFKDQDNTEIEEVKE